jgi:hypothetical protein
VMGVASEGAADVWKAVRMTLNDEPTTVKKWASLQGVLHRELLHYPLSPGLRQHVATGLAKLQQIDPTIKAEPLGHIKLGANERRGPEKEHPPCKGCGLVHKGECW